MRTTADVKIIDLICSRLGGVVVDAKIVASCMIMASPQAENQLSESALTSQVPQTKLHLQAFRFCTDFLDCLSKLRMPLLVCDSSKTSFLDLYQNQLDVCQGLAISFTFSLEFFVE